jgi:D-3-phosphoglycerate dehydrogenase
MKQRKSLKILVTAPYNEEARKVLEDSLGEVIYMPWKQNGKAYGEEDLIGLLKQTGAGALITEHDRVTARVINAQPALAFIGVCRGTPSNVAIEAASDAGIPVFYTPARNAQAVAEMFLATVISFLRRTEAAATWLREERWESGAHDSYLQFKGNELAGKTVGMVGFGAIGHRIAGLLKAFPCPVYFYDPYVTASVPGCEQASLEEVFGCDIVSIHLPANPETEGMIGRSLLSRMKANAIFVNTSRAAVVNREDLLQVLETGAIRGAILDVFDHEPPDETDYKIINLPNVLATPHIAGATFEVEDHHAEIMNRNLLNWYVKHKPEDSFVANRAIVTSTGIMH